MIRQLAIAGAIALMGCEQMQLRAFPPAPNAGPASLHLVPASYFSRHLRPGPDHGPTQQRVEPARPDEPEAEESAVPPETADKLERINDRLQELRRTITRPPGQPMPAESGEWP